MDIAKTICLAYDQFDFVISSFDSSVTHAEPYCIQYVILVALDLEIQLLENTNSAVACPPEEWWAALCSTTRNLFQKSDVKPEYAGSYR